VPYRAYWFRLQVDFLYRLGDSSAETESPSARLVVYETVPLAGVRASSRKLLTEHVHEIPCEPPVVPFEAFLRRTEAIKMRMTTRGIHSWHNVRFWRNLSGKTTRDRDLDLDYLCMPPVRNESQTLLRHPSKSWTDLAYGKTS